MATGTHFGIVISRMPHETYAATLLASQDCRFLCSACDGHCWGIRRLRGETAWLCWRRTKMKMNGQQPGPRPFDTQPSRRLAVEERLSGPGGMWTVSSSERIPMREEGALRDTCVYILTRDDGHQETWRGRDMVDFHLIPPTFDHVTAECHTQLGRALTAAGLSWTDNGRQGTPERLKYIVTDCHGRRWFIRPVASNAITPSKPSSVWQATRPTPWHLSPVMSARALAAYVQELSA
ncbi:hypothetical protein [Streptomyces sp. NPDC059909]|uniref:hypothetical protein n=1 Tax=Streptomyces sp. NPDC059909 TaxID=3346998 RepID=UPI0036490196